MSKILVIEKISKSFQSPRGDENISILKDLSMTVTAGEIVAVTAPSGAGKSTLLNLIGGLDRPDTGSILFQGRDIAKFADIELAKYRNSDIGFVFQEHHLLPQCTVIENVLLPTIPAVSKSNPRQKYEQAENILEKVGLADRTHHLPGQLSGGERQRVALARSLINEPALLLADEPTGSLDRGNAEKLMVLLKQINKQFKTALIVVTHSEALAKQADRRLKLVDGGLS